MTRFLAVFAAILALGALTACNTVKGAGQDVQAGGKAITNVADEAQDEMTE